MLFNSVEFLIFLLVVFVLYWFVFNKNLKIQNLLIFISSYVFYGWWDWRFLSLIFLSTLIDYTMGLKIGEAEEQGKRKALLWVSVMVNLGILGFFKYYNFFIESWVEMFGLMGYKIKNIWTLKVILPVGISFYTFQSLAYTIDVYRRDLKPARDFIAFASFVSFFPQLVAGPIERATHLLPQMQNKRIFKYNEGVIGLRLILWGMFKKVVIADNLSYYVDFIFGNHASLDSLTVMAGAIFFSFQIYCDFSGYSDIAIGTAKLFGFDLMANFKFPYFSRNVGEFWQRWHISLSTWFRDYLYIPLGGSKGGKWLTIRNIFIIFVVSGLWHGANWTFIVWGLIHSVLYMYLFIFSINRKFSNSYIGQGRILPPLKEVFQVIVTFLLVTLAWVFFRSASLSQSISFLSAITKPPSVHQFVLDIKYLSIGADIIYLTIIVSFFVLIEWMNRSDSKNLFLAKNRFVRACLYYLIFFVTLYYSGTGNSFIYFQF